MKLVMVTTSHGHWDGLAGNTAMFSEAVVQPELLASLPEGAVDVIFVKKDPLSRRFEKAWKGRAGAFKRISKQDRNYLSFKIDGLKLINCPEPLRNKTVGCHILQEQPEGLQEAPRRPLAAPLPKLRANAHASNGKLRDEYAEAIVKPKPSIPEPEVILPEATPMKEDEDLYRKPVIIEQELLVPPVYTNGKAHLNGQHETTKEEELAPAFFTELKKSNEPALFEKQCYQLLRLLGIHDIHRPANHAGTEAQGFFKFNTLAVVYTTTLVPAVVQENKMVVDHYLNLLKKDKLQAGNHVYSLKDRQKQVWVITKGAQSSLLRTEDNIKLKVVGVELLMRLCKARIEEENLDADGMWERLMNL